MLDCQPGSTEEMRLEAALLARIMNDAASDPETARAVARAQARRLYCLTLLVIDQLHDTREIFGGALLAGIDADLTDHILGLRDPFGMTIAGELLAWRGTLRHLAIARFGNQV